jgi:hypothetical protein
MFAGDEDVELSLISVGIDDRHGSSEASPTGLTREYERVLRRGNANCQDG